MYHRKSQKRLKRSENGRIRTADLMPVKQEIKQEKTNNY
jgi:hypothetical protein